jgi:hypothetical protein
VTWFSFTRGVLPMDWELSEKTWLIVILLVLRTSG